MGRGFLWMKTLVKSSLDNYVLPGTVTGTEILWLYMIQWRRDLLALLSASFYLLLSQREELKFEKLLFQRDEPSDVSE